jgi:Phage integrase family
MRFARGKFYFDQPQPVDESAKAAAEKAGETYKRKYKWLPLGDDYIVALAEYGKLVRPNWVGRTLHDIFTRYKTDITPLPLKGRTRTQEAIDNELRTIDRFDKVFGKLHQDSLTQPMLYTYIDKRIDERDEFKELKKPAPSAARHDVRFLKKVLSKGIKWGAGTTNAVINLEFEPDPVDARDVTADEFDIVYARANARVQIVMDIADITGLRRKDILKIQIDRDIRADGIHITQGKTLKPIIVEWTPGLRAVVDRALALKPDIPKVFLIRTLNGKPCTPRSFGTMWQKLLRKLTRPGRDGAAPILADRFKFKNLRRKAATDKAKATSIKEASEMLDHANESTTRKHYIGDEAIKPNKVKPVR